MNHYYTGIGSRVIPKEYFDILKDYSSILSSKGYILRSGGADGSDTACELGCTLVHGQKEIYLPWKNFNDNKSELYYSLPEAYEYGERFHPNWSELKPSVRDIMARNSHQIMGRDMKTPTDLVICYTLDGLIQGGTAQAIRIAKHHNIPIYNIFTEKGQAALDLFINFGIL